MRFNYLGLRLILITIIIFSSGCSLKGVIGYKPDGLPLKISVDSDGQINFQVEAGIEIPTPLGTFSIGAVADPNTQFNVPTTLTIRLDEQDHIYDLHGKDFVIDFESAFYDQIRLSKIGPNLYLELVRKGQAPTSFNATFKFNDINNIQKTNRIDFLLIIDDGVTHRYDAKNSYSLKLSPGRHKWAITALVIYPQWMDTFMEDGKGELDLYKDTTFWVEDRQTGFYMTDHNFILIPEE